MSSASPSPSPMTDAFPTTPHSTQTSKPPKPPTPTALIRLFLSSVSIKNTSLMRSLIHPSATAVLIRDNEPRFQTLENTIRTLEMFEGELVERTWDEVEHVDIDDTTGFATVWTRFSIHKDGMLFQLGSSSYSCWKSPERGWIILNMSDIARVQNDSESKDGQGSSF